MYESGYLELYSVKKLIETLESQSHVNFFKLAQIRENPNPNSKE